MDLNGSLTAPPRATSEHLESADGGSDALTQAPAPQLAETSKIPNPKRANIDCDIVLDEQKTCYVPGTLGRPCQRRLVLKQIPQFTKRLANVNSYEIKSSLTLNSIKRSDKDFEVLHNSLLKTYFPLTLPPISYGASNKQREAELQEFFQWIVRHPFLRKCKVWKNFLNDDEWASHKKLSKFEAHKFSFAIATDKLPDIESELLECGKFLNQFDEATKKLRCISCDWIEQLRVTSKRYQKLGETLKGLIKTQQIGSEKEFLQSARRNKIVILIAKSHLHKGIRIWVQFTKLVNFYGDILGPHVKNSWLRSLPLFHLFLKPQDSNTKIATIAEVSFIRRDSEQRLVQAKGKLIDDLFNFQRNISGSLKKFKPFKKRQVDHFDRSMFNWSRKLF